MLSMLYFNAGNQTQGFVNMKDKCTTIQYTLGFYFTYFDNIYMQKFHSS